MGTLDGKVAFVTGAGRRQGRASALRLAEEGADIIAIDLGSDPLTTLSYELSSESDLDETVGLLEERPAKVVKGIGDVRSLEEVQAVVDQGLETFGSTSTSPASSTRSARRCPPRSSGGKAATSSSRARPPVINAICPTTVRTPLVIHGVALPVDGGNLVRKGW